MPRHDLDLFSLVAGIMFAGVAVAALLDQSLDVPARWVLPILLIVVVMAGLVGAAVRSRPPVPGDDGDHGGGDGPG